MKFQFIKVSLIMALSSSVVLTGCLKDGYFNDGQTQSFSGGSTQTIGLNLNNQSTDNYSGYPVPNIFTDTVIDLVPVELGGPTNATQDISVTIDTTSAILDSLNNIVDENGDPAPVGPGDLFNPGTIELVNPVVVIKKGTRVGYLQVKFVPHDYIGQDVGLGFYIKSVSPSSPYVISGNRSSGAMGIIIENYLDGKYILTQKSIGGGAWSGAANGETFNYPTPILYGTIGSNTNTIGTSCCGTNQIAFTPAGGLLSYGALIPAYTVDPVSKAVTVSNLAADDGRGRNFVPNPSVSDSRYDPATKTLYISYGVIQTGRTTMYIYDTLVYSSPR